MTERYYHISGLVQGVGFRPFVAESCSRLSLGGWVANSGGSVELKICGREEAVDELIRRLFALNEDNSILPGARISEIKLLSEEKKADDPDTSFTIRESVNRSDSIRILPVDTGVCDSCMKELFDPGSRRYRHPFISCVSCGPRYTIMKEVPYDRNRTTMSSFDLCIKCNEDYTRVGDIRRYAQTICCNDCGPVLKAHDINTGIIHTGNERALESVVRALKDEKIAAIKDVGGYHLAHLASSGKAIRRLRELKSRKYKAFAVMFADMPSIERVAYVSETEKKLLMSSERPIVLLEQRETAYGISGDIAPDSNLTGAMLPCNPTLLMIIKETGPLVMTSANPGGEPIICDDDLMEQAAAEYGGIDIILSNNRKIESGLDDSVCRVVRVGDDNNREDIVQIIRRARGYVPKPIAVKGKGLPADAMAAGGDLKSVFAIGKGEAVYLSGHFGDLASEKACQARAEAIKHMERLFDAKPAVFVGDAHPGYISSKELPGGFVPVMHHHAHIMSVMAEHDLGTNVLGVAYDGTGYGDDGNVWGGEFLICDKSDYIRAGHIRYVKLVGGDISAKDCDITAYGWLEGSDSKERFYDDIIKRKIDKKDKDAFELRCKAMNKNINTIYSSSAGRLFDAAAAVLDICHDNEYEGRAPLMVECFANSFKGDESEKYRILRECPAAEIRMNDGVVTADPSKIIEWLFNKRCEGLDISGLAYAFHSAVADMTTGMCEGIIKAFGLKDPPIALSGGTMNNSLLLKMLLEQFYNKGLRVYINKDVPCGDGGIALGQMYYLMRSHEE